MSLRRSSLVQVLAAGLRCLGMDGQISKDDAAQSLHGNRPQIQAITVRSYPINTQQPMSQICRGRLHIGKKHALGPKPQSYDIKSQAEGFCSVHCVQLSPETVPWNSCRTIRTLKERAAWAADEGRQSRKLGEQAVGMWKGSAPLILRDCVATIGRHCVLTPPKYRRLRDAGAARKRVELSIAAMRG